MSVGDPLERLRLIHRKVSYANDQGCGMICVLCRSMYPCETIVELDSYERRVSSLSGQLDAIDTVLKWKGSGHGRVESMQAVVDELEGFRRDHTESGGCYGALPRLRAELEDARLEGERLQRRLASYTVGEVVMDGGGDHIAEVLQILNVREVNSVLCVRVARCSKERT
jgi:hypothetical protein